MPPINLLAVIGKLRPRVKRRRGAELDDLAADTVIMRDGSTRQT